MTLANSCLRDYEINSKDPAGSEEYFLYIIEKNQIQVSLGHFSTVFRNMYQ